MVDLHRKGVLEVVEVVGVVVVVHLDLHLEGVAVGGVGSVVVVHPDLHPEGVVEVVVEVVGVPLSTTPFKKISGRL